MLIFRTVPLLMALFFLMAPINGFAQDILDVYDNDDARMAKKLANKIEPMINLPIQYDFYQKSGIHHNQYQDRIVLQPMLPVPVTQDWNFLIRPLLTANFQYQAGMVTNQTSPFQFETFISPSKQGDFTWGIGPYFQIPCSGTCNGSNQYGAGVSAAAFYKPDQWVIGGIMYNSWGVGGSNNNGTVNVFYAVPSISYVTNSAWTWTATMQPSFNYNTRNSSNPFLLLGAKTTTLFGVPLQIQAGPSYMVSTTPTSGQGLGFRVQLTVAAKE